MIVTAMPFVAVSNYVHAREDRVTTEALDSQSTIFGLLRLSSVLGGNPKTLLK
jgi:hypothetical protein